MAPSVRAHGRVRDISIPPGKPGCAFFSPGPMIVRMARHFSHEDMLASGNLVDLFEHPERYGVRIDGGDPETWAERAGNIVDEARSRLDDLRSRTS